MQLTLNFKLGTPTVNGRIYSPKSLTDEFDRLIENDRLFVTLYSHTMDEFDRLIENGTVPIDNIVAKVNSWDILHDNTVVFDVKLTDKGEQFKHVMDIVSTSGMGVLKESEKIYLIKDYTLFSLFCVIEGW